MHHIMVRQYLSNHTFILFVSHGNVYHDIQFNGETIFSMIPQKEESKVLDILQKYSDGILIKSVLDDDGARVLNN